eukprot:8542-Heterococcus_DN1.PRE.4
MKGMPKLRMCTQELDQWSSAQATSIPASPLSNRAKIMEKDSFRIAQMCMQGAVHLLAMSVSEAAS